jgi:SAM-dependent methyltransferase
MIARAQESYPGICFEVQDAEALGYDDSSYDVVTMNFGMLHLGSPEKAASEVARVLRPGGRFGFTVWAEPQQALGFSVILQAIEQHGASHVALPAGPPFFKYSNPDTARSLLKAAGFNAIRAEQINLIWRLSCPEEFFTAFHLGTARTGGLLRAQPGDHLSLIRGAVESVLQEQWSAGEGARVAIPMSVMVYTGRIEFE